MEFIWSPWRYDYMASIGKKVSACVFCLGEDPAQDADRLVLHRGTHNFIILNLFPYTTGHLMIAPFAHLASVVDAPVDQTTEMMALLKRSLDVLTKAYHPEGFNVGMNLGQVAGAGVKDHFHLHIVPRWSGDANFMTITGETRVLPEALATSYQRLKAQMQL